ncbi:MAG: hypothetical protein LWX07_09020 [Bacteroidetes bacterium]|nr:hypothetical protein [Bacteroidota bacterium]
MKNLLRGKFGFYIICILVFSFLLSGCYTTDYYSDTPENIMAGKSEVKINDNLR